MCNRQSLLHNLQDTVQNTNGDLLSTKLAESFLLAFAICLMHAPQQDARGSGPTGGGDNEVVAGRGRGAGA